MSDGTSDRRGRGSSSRSSPERRLQDAEEARELRHHQTLDGGVVGSQSEQVPHQRPHLRTRADREDDERRGAAPLAFKRFKKLLSSANSDENSEDGSKLSGFNYLDQLSY